MTNYYCLIVFFLFLFTTHAMAIDKKEGTESAKKKTEAALEGMKVKPDRPHTEKQNGKYNHFFAYGSINLTNDFEGDYKTTVTNTSTGASVSDDLSVEYDLKGMGLGIGIEYLQHITIIQMKDRSVPFKIAGGFLYEFPREIESITATDSTGTSAVNNSPENEIKVSTAYVKTYFEPVPNINLFLGIHKAFVSFKKKTYKDVDGKFGFLIGGSYDINFARVQLLYRKLGAEVEVSGSSGNLASTSKGDIDYDGFMLLAGITF